MSWPGSSDSYAEGRTRNLVLLPVMLILPYASLHVRFTWRRMFNAYVAEEEWYGLGLLEIVVLAWAIGFAGWVACWLLLQRPRALVVAQVATALLGTLVVQGFLIVEALQNRVTSP